MAVSYTHLDVYKRQTHYRGTFNDGTQFDSSYDRGEPLEFICGARQMIRGFDAAVADMEVGQIIDAVSYTHLDVYKRQTIRRLAAHAKTFLTSGIICVADTLLNSCLLYTSGRSMVV